MESQIIAPNCNAGLLFLYFHLFGYGMSLIDPSALAPSGGNRFARAMRTIRIAPLPLWRSALAALFAASPLYIPWAARSGIAYSLYIGAIAVLLMAPCTSYGLRYGNADGSPGVRAAAWKQSRRCSTRSGY